MLRHGLLIPYFYDKFVAPFPILRQEYSLHDASNMTMEQR